MSLLWECGGFLFHIRDSQRGQGGFLLRFCPLHISNFGVPAFAYQFSSWVDHDSTKHLKKSLYDKANPSPHD